MWTDEHYGQVPKYSINGLTLNLLAWHFSYGAEYKTDPAFVAVGLQPMSVVFTQANVKKQATLYVVPVSESPDHYYLSEWSLDPTLFQSINPPASRWTDKIRCVECLEITIPATGEGSAIVVTANEFDLPDPPDPRRNVVGGDWRIMAFMGGQQTAGFELLDAQKHATAFPVSLGKLSKNEQWYAKKET